MRSRALTTSLVLPQTESADARRARRSAERRIRRDAHHEQRAERASAVAVERAAQIASGDVPVGGQRRPHALHTWRRLNLPAHRATTTTLAAAYLFQAESAPAHPGTLIGHDAYTRTQFCFDPWNLYAAGAITNPNILIAGEIGSGKSALAKALVSRGNPFGRRAYVPGDVKGEWTPVAAALGGATIALGPGQAARLNPLDEGVRPGGLDDHQWDSEVRSRRLELLRSLIEHLAHRPIGPTERSALAFALDTTTGRDDVPLIGRVVDVLFTPDKTAQLPAGFASRRDLCEAGHEIGHLLASLVSGELAGLFDGPSTVRFDPTLPMMTIDISALGESNPAMPLIMTCTSAWTEAALRDPNGGKRFVIYDEAWRVMRELALLRRMQSAWKLSRAWGLANVAVVHRLSDFAAVGSDGSEHRALAAGLVADTATRIIYRQKADQLAATADALGLSRTERSLLTSLARGTGLWRIGERAPQLVAHTLTRAEKTMFDTDQRMIERIAATHLG